MMSTQSKPSGERQSSSLRGKAQRPPNLRSPIDSAAIRTQQLHFQVEAGEDSVDEGVWRPFASLPLRRASLRHNRRAAAAEPDSSEVDEAAVPSTLPTGHSPSR